MAFLSNQGKQTSHILNTRTESCTANPGSLIGGLKSLLKFQPQARSFTYLLIVSADLYQLTIFHCVEKTVQEGYKYELQRHSPLLCSPCEHRSTFLDENLFRQRYFT